MHEPNATIIWKKLYLIRKIIPKLEKAFRKFVELVKTNPLMYNVLYSNQYSRLSIRLNIFRFSANNSKTNLKFEEMPSISL